MPNAVLDKLGINAEEVLSFLSLTPKPQTIFLSGSIIEGYGNAESDLDAYMVYPDKLPRKNVEIDRQGHNISLEFTSKWRIDIERWLFKEIESVAQRLNNCPANDVNACFKLRFDSGLDLAHRIRIGIPIFEEETFYHIQNRFNIDHVSHIIASIRFMEYQGVSEDASGAIATKQYGTALLMSRKAIQRAIDMLAATHGETNVKEKWRFFKLEKINEPEILDTYWDLETKGCTGKDEILAYCKQCLRFANQVVLKAQKIRPIS